MTVHNQPRIDVFEKRLVENTWHGSAAQDMLALKLLPAEQVVNNSWVCPVDGLQVRFCLETHNHHLPNEASQLGFPCL